MPAEPKDRAAAFENYVLPEVEVLLRVALSITRSAPDAEDLVQDTLLRAYRAIDRFDARHPRAWLLTILRNAQVSRTRRRRPGLLHDPDEVTRLVSAVEDRHADPEHLVVSETFDEELDAALRALPEKFRQAVELVDADELSYHEAAEVLGVPVGTVTSRLFRARKRLRDRLARSGALRRKAAR